MAESCLVLLGSKETKQRLDGLAQLEAAMGTLDLDPDTIGRIVSALVPVIADYNPKLALGAMQLVQQLGRASGPDFGPHALSVWANLIERMGDSKLPVRATATATIVGCMAAIGPISGVERLRLALEHKNPRAREQGLEALALALQDFGARASGVHGMLPHAVRLLEDSDSNVRDAAAALLEHMYAQLGEPLCDELARSGLRPAVLKTVLDRLGALVAGTDLPPAAAVALLRREHSSSSAHDAQPGAGGPQPSARRVPSPLTRGRQPSPRPSLGVAAAGPRFGTFVEPPALSLNESAGELDVLSPSADVKPLRVHTERDLVRELESVALDLKGGLDWTTRQAALRRVQALLLGGAASLGSADGSQLLLHLRPLREPLNAQLADLRSQIIREACVTISMLAAALGELFEAYADFFFERLLKQTVITIAVISSSAHLCLRALLTRTRPQRTAPRIAAAMVDRSSAIRVRAGEYLELLARVLPTPAEGERGPLERHADVLVGALRSSLRDAVAEVRAVARSAFWALNAQLPAHCAHLLESVDAQTQRLIREEEAASSERSLALSEQLTHRHSQAQSHAGSHFTSQSSQEQTQRSRASSAPRRAQPPPAPPPRATAVRAEIVADRGGAAAAAAAAAGRMAQQQRAGVGAGGYGGGSSMLSQINQMLAAAPVAGAGGGYGGGLGAAARVSVAGSGGGGAGAGGSAAESAQHAGRASAVTGARRIVVAHEAAAAQAGGGGGSGQRAAGAGVMQAWGPLAPSDDAGGAFGAQHEGSRGLAQQQQQQGPQSHAAAAAAAAASSAALQLSQDEALATVLAKRDSLVWSVRAACLQQVGAMVGSEREAELLHPQAAQQVVAIIMSHLTDAHYRVVLSALECLAASSHVLAHSLEPSLERLLPRVLVKLGDPKDAVRAKAEVAVSALRSALLADSLLPVLLRVLDSPLVKVRVSALEMTSSVCAVPEATAWLSQSNHVRLCATKIAPLLAEKTPELRRAAAGALYAMLAAAPHAFGGALLSLPAAVQQLARRALAEKGATLAPETEAPPLPLRPSQQQQPQQQQQQQLQAAVAVAAAAAQQQQAVRRQQPQTQQPQGGRASTPPPGGVAAAAAAAAAAAQQCFGGGGRAAYSQPRVVEAVVIEAAAMPLRPPLRDATTHAQRSVAESKATAAWPGAEQGDCAAVGGLGSGEAAGASHGAGDASSDWLSLMPSLLRQLGSGQPAAAQRESLLRVAKMTAALPATDPVWRKHFEHVLEAELRLLESDDDRTREAAISATRELLRTQRERFVTFTEHVMLRLLAAHRDGCREVCQAAEECLELVVTTSDPRRCLAVLIPVATREESPVLQASIRLISRIVPRMGAAELQLLLPQLLPPLFDAFKSPSADVRKAVVFALVDMYLVLGDQLTPHLSELSTSQLKLVTIYINRTTKTRAEIPLS